MKLTHVSSDIFKVNVDVLVSVASLLLMPETKRVPKLMHCDAKLCERVIHD